VSDRYCWNPIWKKLTEAVEVYPIGGISNSLYVEWSFVPGLEKGFWAFAGGDSSLRTAYQDNPVATRSVYAYAGRGGPLGEIMAQVSLDQRKRKSLLVASRGIINPSPCEECRRKYKSFSTDQGNPTAVMYPFFDCISLPGYFNDDCANCIWNTTTTCNYRSFVFTRAAIRAGKGPGKLTRKAAPRTDKRVGISASERKKLDKLEAAAGSK
jgi:hypothetical protein